MYKLVASLAIAFVFLILFEQVVWANQIVANAIGGISSGHVLSSNVTNDRQVFLGKSLLPLPMTKTNKLLSVSSKEHAAIDSDKGSPTSNAYNFHAPWTSNINPRTGQVQFSFPIDTMFYDTGLSSWTLQLSYTSSPTATTAIPGFSLGSDWSWSIGRELLSNSEINGHLTTKVSLGDGHSLVMESDRDQNGNVVWRPLRHKLKDIKVYGYPGDWVVVSSSGKKERILNGYEQWQEDKGGKRIHFYYDRNGPNDTTRSLRWICPHVLSEKEQHANNMSVCPNGIMVTSVGDDIIVNGRQKIVFRKHQYGDSSGIEKISMPDLTSQDIKGIEHKEATINFTYDVTGNRPWLVSKIQYPTGLIDTFLYNEESNKNGEQKTFGLRIGVNRRIPVVTEHVVSTGTTPNQKTYFYYGSDSTDDKNYTGYQLGKSMIPGRDNLLDRSSEYTYSTELNDGITLTRTTFNKYHLPISVKSWIDGENKILSQKTISYPKWKNTTFDQLPPNYSLKTAENNLIYTPLLSSINEFSPARTKQSFRYNNMGKEVWRQDDYGRTVITQYCPPEGDKFCPPADPKWPDMQNIEKMVLIPASSSPAGAVPAFMANSTNPPKYAQEKEFSYIRLPERVGDPDADSLWQVSSKSQGCVPLADIDVGQAAKINLPDLSDSNITKTTNYQYNNNLQSDSYGMLAQMTINKKYDGTLAKTVGVTPNAFSSELQKESSVTLRVNNSLNTKQHLRLLQVETQSPVGANNFFGASDSDIRVGNFSYSTGMGHKVSSADNLKQITTHWDYDLWNRKIKKTVISKDGNLSQVTTWSYIVTPEENAIITTSPEGNQSKTIFSAKGQKLSTWHRFSNQTDKQEAGKSNWIQDTAITWSSHNKPLSETIWHASDAQSGKEGRVITQTTTFGYDAHNRLNWKKNPDNSVNVSFLDDDTNEKISYQAYQIASTNEMKLRPTLLVQKYTPLGKISDVYLLPLNPQATRFGKPVYSIQLQQKLIDINNHLLRLDQLPVKDATGLINPDDMLEFIHQAMAEQAWLNHSSRIYDGFGRLTRQIAGDGAVTSWVYSKASEKPLYIVLPDGRKIHDTTNVFGGKVSRCVVPLNGSGCHVLGKRYYDDSGNVSLEEDEYGNHIVYSYDADDRVISKVTPPTKAAPKGHIFTYDYNSAGVTKNYKDGRLYVKYDYDPHSLEVIDKYDSFSHTHYTYSARFPHQPVRVDVMSADALSGITPSTDIHSPSYTETYTYNQYGIQTGMTDSMGNHYISTHDRQGRIIMRQVILFGHSEPQLLEKITYNVDGKVSTISNGAGITRTFIYDGLGQVGEVEDDRNGIQLERFSYTWDPNTSNMLTMTRDEHGESATQKYTYDPMDNLVSMSCSKTGADNTPSVLCPRDTDISNSGLLSSPVIMQQLYKFDTWNNISTVTEKVAAGNKFLIKTMQYRYDGDGKDLKHSYDPNRMISYQTRWSGQASSVMPAVITYDSMSRIVKDTKGNLLHYNGFGQQDSFTNSKTHEMTRYFYNSDDQQIAEQPFSSQGIALQAPLYFLYDDGGIAGEKQVVSGVMHSTSELGGMAHEKDGHLDSWYLHDYKGDLIKQYNTQGVETSSKVYSPYGMVFDLDDTLMNRLEQKPLSSQKAWVMLNTLGFNDERADPATGYQFLGAGYRAYNPVYRHFMTKDSFAPFKTIDGYGFVSNNPIMHTDPTGHLPKWIGYLTGALTVVIGLAMSVLLPMAVVSAGATGISLVTSVIANTAVSGLGSASGALGIAATVDPSNGNLKTINDEVGLAAGVLGLIPVAAIESLSLPLDITEDTLRGVATFRKALKGLAIASTWSGTTAWGVGASSSGLSVLEDYWSKAKASSGVSEAVDVLNYLFTVGSAASLCISISTLGFGLKASSIEKAILNNSERVNKTAGEDDIRAVSSSDKSNAPNGSTSETMDSSKDESGPASTEQDQPTLLGKSKQAGVAPGTKVASFARLAGMALVLAKLLGAGVGSVHIVSEIHSRKKDQPSEDPGSNHFSQQKQLIRFKL